MTYLTLLVLGIIHEAAACARTGAVGANTTKKTKTTTPTTTTTTTNPCMGCAMAAVGCPDPTAFGITVSNPACIVSSAIGLMETTDPSTGCTSGSFTCMAPNLPFILVPDILLAIPLPPIGSYSISCDNTGAWNIPIVNQQVPIGLGITIACYSGAPVIG